MMEDDRDSTQKRCEIISKAENWANDKLKCHKLDKNYGIIYSPHTVDGIWANRIDCALLIGDDGVVLCEPSKSEDPMPALTILLMRIQLASKDSGFLKL
jgi:hypothetical protein